MAEWVGCNQLKNLDINIRLAKEHLSAQPGVLLERESAGQSPEEVPRVPDSTSSSRAPTNQSASPRGYGHRTPLTGSCMSFEAGVVKCGWTLLQRTPTYRGRAALHHPPMVQERYTVLQ